MSTKADIRVITVTSQPNVPHNKRPTILIYPTGINLSQFYADMTIYSNIKKWICFHAMRSITGVRSHTNNLMYSRLSTVGAYDHMLFAETCQAGQRARSTQELRRRTRYFVSCQVQAISSFR